MKNKILSILLIISMFLSIFNVFVFANELSYLEGLIITNSEDQLQILSLDGKFYNISSDMEKDVEAFCNIIANSGVKLTLTISEDKQNNALKILGIYTAKELPEKIQKQWEAYQKKFYGLYTELEGVIVKTADVYSFVTTDTIYSPLKFEYTYVGGMADIIANTGIKVKIESSLYDDNSLLISYIETSAPMPEKYLKELEEYIKQQEEKDSKVGVIVSYGPDTYMLVEKNTNKMYYLTTSDSYIYITVPILADQGYEVSVNGIATAENELHLYALKTMEDVPDSVVKEIEAADKARFESTFYNIEGYITFDNEKDYNIHFGDGEVLGLETRVEDVAKVIVAVANDETVKLKLEGFINYEQTVMDVRTVTFLVDITEGETLKKLQEAFPEPKTTENNTLTNSSNNQNFTTGSTVTENTSSFDSLFSSMLESIYGTGSGSSMSDLFATYFANSNLNEIYSSQTNGTTNNFSSMFGSNTSDFFAEFNAMSQNQSSMLNSDNLENFNFEEFQTAFDSMGEEVNNPQTGTTNNNTNFKEYQDAFNDMGQDINNTQQTN